MALHPHVRQGRYGEAFVKALVESAGLSVQAGLTAQKDEPDDFSVDLRIGHNGPLGTLHDPMIAVQVKSWNAPRGNSENWSYPLKCKYFNELAGPASMYMMPRFLVVVLVPKSPDDWAEANTERLVLRQAAYWTCLHGEERRKDLAADSKVRVSVPRDNLLTESSIMQLFDHAEQLRTGGRGVMAR